MLTYPNINPVAFYVYHWPVHWYGIMYLIGFVAGWALLALRVRFAPKISHGITQDMLADIIFYSALGVVIGGRLGYMLFYNWSMTRQDPLLIFETWKGGMSFHGGLIGVCIALFIFGWRNKKPFLVLTDFIVPVVPIGLGAGRIGNFINGELWGKVTTMPWGMVFPDGGPLPRHPSELYEFGLEGVVLFIVLWLFSRKPRPMGAISGLFAVLYGIFRSVAEFFRLPDPQIGYLAFGWVTEGQILSLPLILIGIGLLIFAYTPKKGKI